MLAEQRKVCFLAVIELVLGPGVRVMTVFAFLAVFTLMAVIMPVATVTVGRQFFFFSQAFGRVATAAGRFGMAAQQAEIGFLSMIKFYLVPLVWCVTTLAFFTIAAPVNILYLVAANTGIWRVLVFLIDVAGRTQCFLVFSFEGKVGFFVMVKSVLLP